MQTPQPSRLMWLFFIGLAASFGYGLISTIVLYLLDGPVPAKEFAILYIGPFNTLVSFGIIFGTALIVGGSQTLIPNAIEAAFTEEELSETDYYENKRKYYSIKRTIAFASELIIFCYIIFSFCHFPLTGLAEGLMMTAVCAQWAVASYVGRKLRYAGMMLHSLISIRVRRNLFKEGALDIINTIVHIGSTMAVVFIYVHVRSYYNGPFLYDSFLGESVRVFLLSPAVFGAPVLLMFNFFPREAIRKIYDKSIDVEVKNLESLLKAERLGPFEKKIKLLELSKMHREELRYSLQLSLSDLPIGITILFMIAEPILGK